MQKRFLRSLLLAAGMICALAPAVASSQTAPAMPDTPAGQVFGTWLAAFNTGDRESVKRFFETYRPERVARVDDELRLRQSTGGLDLRKIVASTPTSVTALVQERASDDFFRITFEVQSDPPHRVVKRQLLPAERPPEFALPHLSQPQLIADLDELLRSQSARDRFSGTVLIAKDGKPVFTRAYGMADRSRKIPNAPATGFRLGSMNKMFTATAIMQLVQAGKVDLDSPFGAYLTDYPNADVAQSVTIRQLLQHTGGTGDIFGPEYDKKRLQLRTLQDYIDLYGKRPLLFKPGSKWDYSNYGFILLGAVIQKVSGQDYYDYVNEHIYAPSGMTASGSDPEDAAVPGRSIGYTMGENGWTPNTGLLPYRGTPAGGGYSTAGDLLSFANAIESHRLLDAQHTAMLTTGSVDSPMGRYAFGFDEQHINGTHCFGHGGGAEGMNGQLKICPEARYTIVVLSNFDPPAAERVADFIANRLPKR